MGANSYPCPTVFGLEAGSTDGLSPPHSTPPAPSPTLDRTPAWQVGGNNMLRLQVGSASFEVSLADIQKHPGTLLHDLVDLEPEATRQPVLLDPTTPLTLPSAQVLTQALYR